MIVPTVGPTALCVGWETEKSRRQRRDRSCESVHRRHYGGGELLSHIRARALSYAIKVSSIIVMPTMNPASMSQPEE